MHKILIVGEHDGKTLNPATAKCVTCAQGIADAEITIVLLGADTAAAAAQAAALAGVKAVLRVDRPENLHPLAAVFAPQLAALAADYSHVFGPSTSFGKDLMPRLAALLGVAQVSDLMAVESAYRFRHVLIRDAAYRSLPKNARADLHERFADWLEQRAEGRLAEVDERVGRHLTRAVEYRRLLDPDV